jgi:hypothetical protein
VQKEKIEMSNDELEKLLNGTDKDLLVAIWQLFFAGQPIDQFTHEQRAVIGRLIERLRIQIAGDRAVEEQRDHEQKAKDADAEFARIKLIRDGLTGQWDEGGEA